MKINFKSISFKNFMSYTTQTTFNFEDGMHLITGTNGTGKTTMFIALYYVLFGKPYKKTKVGSLINNTINKDMLVSVEFTINADSYKVIRAQKPQVFEIYKNDVLINQSATTSEYQILLENDILKMSEHVFKQLIFLGANVSTSKSFVDLTKAEKEELFQVITDTSVFSELKELIKQKIKHFTQTQKDIDFKHKVLVEDIQNVEINNQKLMIQNQRILEHNSKLVEQQNALNEKIVQCNSDITKYTEALVKIKDKKTLFDAVKTELTEQKQVLSEKTLQHKTLEAQLNKIQNVENSFSVCIGCDKLKTISSVDISIKPQILLNMESLHKSIVDITTHIDTLNVEYTSLQEMFEKAKLVKSKKELQEESLLRYAKDLESLIILEVVEVDEHSVAEKKSILEQYTTELEIIKNTLQNYSKLHKLLHNNNLKGLIIKQALPVLNKYVNFYLDNFSDFPFKFNIDEHFVSSIKNIHNIHSPIDYEFSSLSNGQSMRITFCLVLAFLELIKFKNGISTNILILDEILDSSLDYTGRSELLSVIKQTFIDNNNNCVFVISHNDDITSNEIFDTQYKIKNKHITRI